MVVPAHLVADDKEIRDMRPETKASTVIPAKAGIHCCAADAAEGGIKACGAIDPRLRGDDGGGKISVIIPFWNTEKYIAATLKCVAAQTYENLEVILVSDCPTDGTEKIAAEFAARDPRFKLIRNEKNMDLAISRNRGVAAACGDYIHFMDADDLISPDFYEVMLNAARENDADVAACCAFYEKKPWKSIWFQRPEVLRETNEKIRKTLVTVQGWAWRYLIRREFWNAHGFEFPSLRPLEDMPAMIPMVYYANRIALCPDAVYFYKHREGSIINQARDPEKQKRYHENRTKARAMFRGFMREHNIKAPNRLWQSIKRRFFL